MSRGSAIGCLVAALGLAGCFYVDPINQRPAVDIRATSSDPVYRGGHVVLLADASDPEGHYLRYTWRAYACTDATALDTCDREPFYTEVLDRAEFDVPIVRADAAVPVQSLRVVLEVRDELGAGAKPQEELVIPVLNAPPTLRLDRDFRPAYVVTKKIKLSALVEDADDGAAQVTEPEWEVFGPAGSSHTLEVLDVPQPSDPAQAQYGRVLTPMHAGDWEIRVTARDPLGAEAVQTLMLFVQPDGPPCLAQLAPIVPTGGNALPITEETLFRVPVVVDDLDVYPPIPSDDELGVARFQWSLQAPGQTGHVALAGAVGNSYAIDPAGYTPGDVLELRVEIFDRNNTVIPCIDSEQTCSVISQPTCIQRQTWRVEIR